MENTNKGLIGTNWVPQNSSARIFCPSPTNLDFDKEKASLGARSPCFSAFQAGIAAQTSACSKEILKHQVSGFRKRKCNECFKKPIADKGHQLVCPKLFFYKQLSLVVNKQGQKTMKKAIKIFLAFQLFQKKGRKQQN